MKTKDEHRHTSTNNNITNPKHIISTHGIWVSNLLGGFQITMWTTQKIATPNATIFFFFVHHQIPQTSSPCFNTTSLTILSLPQQRQQTPTSLLLLRERYRHFSILFFTCTFSNSLLYGLLRFSTDLSFPPNQSLERTNPKIPRSTPMDRIQNPNDQIVF